MLLPKNPISHGVPGEAQYRGFPGNGERNVESLDVGMRFFRDPIKRLITAWTFPGKMLACNNLIFLIVV
jgi:hypothetical protein